LPGTVGLRHWQVWLVVLHEEPVPGQWAAVVHWTQALLKHPGVGAEQLASDMHWTQVVPAQKGLAVVQSVLARQPTQLLVVVRQIGVAPLHVFVQLMDWPQLLVAGPHALPVQAAVLLGVQPQALGPTPPPPHVLAPVQVLVQVMD
jgi:hypothetical protein